MHLFLSQLANNKNVKVSIIALDYPYQPKVYDWKNLRIHAIGGNNKRGFLKLKTYRKAIKTALSIHHKIEIDRVHSFWLGDAALVGNQIKKKLNIPHACTLMGQDVLLENSYFKKFKDLPDLIALSKFHAQALEKNFGIKPNYIIPWGIENLENKTELRSIDIIGVGNLTPLKSFSRLVYVVSELKQRMPNIKAVLVGEGPELDSLKKLAKELNVEKNIEFTGVLNREQTLDKMRQSKTLLHCSTFESFGLVITEAVALGLKVYSTPVGISTEIDSVVTYKTDKELLPKITSFLELNQLQKPQIYFGIEQTTDSYLKEVF
jgi:glycosyltransferase involved in cell wall biosynthesis